MAVCRFLTLHTTALLQIQSPGSLGHSASKPRAQCLAAVIPRDNHGHDGNEDYGDHGHDDGNGDYRDYGHDGNGDYGDHGGGGSSSSGDEPARTATVAMHA